MSIRAKDSTALNFPGATEPSVAARWFRCRASSSFAALSASASAAATSEDMPQPMGAALALRALSEVIESATACAARNVRAHSSAARDGRQISGMQAFRKASHALLECRQPIEHQRKACEGGATGRDSAAAQQLG